MPTPAHPAEPRPRGLPQYALYGEPRSPAMGEERLHLESIAERSRLHDWEIQPHRHTDFFQFLYIGRGRAEASLDGRVLALAGPCLLGVPAGAAHGFRFSPRVRGLVITVRQSHMAALLAVEPTLRGALLATRHTALRGAAAVAVGDAVAALRRELAWGPRWRRLGIDAALLRLAIEAGRAGPDPAGPQAPYGTRAQHHAERYRALVEQHFRAPPGLAALARQLGITPTQLNRVCHQVHGRGALALLHERVALEAQRDLTYTTLSIKQIALGLGFADAAYFTRFFRRLAGCTPSRWRGAGRPA